MSRTNAIGDGGSGSSKQETRPRTCLEEMPERIKKSASPDRMHCSLLSARLLRRTELID